MFTNILIGLGIVVVLVIGILFARKNPKKAALVAQGVAAAGQKAEDLAKQAVSKMKGK